MADWTPTTKELSDIYGRGFAAIQIVQRGVNYTYRLSDGTRNAYLRQYREEGRDRSQIEFEIQALAQYQGDPRTGVARPIPGVDGQKLRMLGEDGSTFAVLFEEAPGLPLSTGAYEGRAPNLYALGAHIGRLHDGLQRSLPTEIRTLLPNDLAPQAAANLAALNLNLQPLVHAVLAAAEAVSGVLARKDLSWGVCHGDPWFRNVHVDGDVATFIDFDDCGIGPLIFDIAVAARHIDGVASQQRTARIGDLLRGYRHVRPLSLSEVEALPSLAMANEVSGLSFLARYRLLSPDLWTEQSQRVFNEMAFWRDPATAAALVAEFEQSASV